ncbi:hypothetical protein [Jiulongibacter sediminis]|uniref:Peptidase M10 metallopeptidase domain-containing protein n=1 Tax=Jiulongibacter sediminis TaxID=1605367 RepID=A0A0P7BSL4_9BACT|nr:hypothetical protein [Jiulongibacter sediminis]KPM47459.1 hypothetical protein AFM12_13180 [Jiulongibacter sediminis]TBX23254.1 hypothetical protein TK44_13190 [Jiulongibacter sediminis]
MKIQLLSAAVLAGLVFSCTDNQTPEMAVSEKAPELKKSMRSLRVTGDQTVAVYMAEYITIDAATGNTVFFNDRGNKQLSADFVPLDPRRGGRANITYLVDDEFTSDNGLTAAELEQAIDNGMNTWDAEGCSNLGITKVPYSGNSGFVSSSLGFGGDITLDADIQHSGFLPRAFFDALAPGGGDFILGVTFTLLWQDGAGNFTDIDNNGKLDVAFREIYYNDKFSWNTDGNSYDLETIALHESGHALSQAHFGKAFRSGGNGKLHFSPRAVMNAAYSGVQRDLKSTDHSGHCSNWSSWPNN